MAGLGIPGQPMGAANNGAGAQPGATPAATGSSFMQYDPSQSATTNAQNMVNNQNQQYQGFLSNLPGYQAGLNNQAIDQGAAGYNAKKQSIDENANSRGLLYSGLKQGAEAGAASDAAASTANKISQNNENINNYATGYGNQVAQSNIANQQGNVNSALLTYGQGLQSSAANSQAQSGLLGGLGSIGGLFASDEDLKEDIKDADEDSNEMVDKIKPSSFKYKDDGSKEKHFGVMAQDLEKSPMGKSLVVETPAGKGVDMKKALAAVLAVQGALDKRLKKVGA